MSTERLFADGDLAATLRHQRERALRAVDEMPEGRFKAGDPSEVATEVYTRYQVSPISLTEGAISVEASEADIDRRRFRDFDHGFPGAPPTLRGMRVIYNVPFTGDQALFQLRPSTWTAVVPFAIMAPQELQFVYEVRSSEVGSTKQSFEQDLSLTKRYLDWSQEEVARFNKELARAIEGAVNHRNARLDEASQGLADLGIPVRTYQQARVDPPDSEDVAARKGRSGAEASTERYDVALSFAGEDRDFVERVARRLKDAGVRVFYDGFEKASLWGKDLIAHLQDIYQNRAQYCVLFISEHYVTKPWPRHERQSAQSRALLADDEYLLPARFDDSILPGLPTAIGFVDLRQMNAEEFARLVLEKLEWEAGSD